MRILLLHNFYQRPGGEDAVLAAETDLLRARGHEVESLTVHNEQVDQMGRLALAAGTVWSRQGYRKVEAVAQAFRPEVAHFHNTLPLFSPAAYYAARRSGAAVVQTIHNFRLLCPAATLFRQGEVCERCVGRAVAWPAVALGCYRASRPASAAVAAMLATHRLLGTYRRQIDAYIALTDFSRRKLITGGLPAEKIHLKANFVDPDPQAGRGEGGFMLFVGRLDEEKGLKVLLEAWRSHAPAVDLRLLGEGPLAGQVEQVARENPRVQWLGRRSPAEVLAWMGRATALIFPSQWYEGMPRTIIESFAKGTPVIASRLGAMAEMIAENQTGLLFAPGDAAALARCVTALQNRPEPLAAMRLAARREYENRYTAERNYPVLESIYQTALERRRAGR